MHFRLIKNDNFDYESHYKNEKSAIKNVTKRVGYFLYLALAFLIVYNP